MPTGTIVHNVEITPGQGGKLGRSAGTSIQLAAKEGDMVTLRLPSSEMRLVRAECRATVGVLSNAEHQNLKVGKAGRSRHKGKRPQSRGVAMNPVDHPHGGGEAHHTPGGHPVTPWGKPTLGYRTRKKGKQSDRYIVRGRRRGKKKALTMGRSTKKGPLVEEALMKRITAMNDSGTEADGEDLVAQPRPSSPRWSGTRSPFTTGASTSPSSSPSRWSATSWASSRRPEPSAPTPAPARAR